MKELVYEGRRVTVKGRGITEVVLEEKAALRQSIDRGKAEKKKTEKDFPEGALGSLRQLLRSVFDDGFDEEAYWARVVDAATMTPQEAVNKLRAGKFSCEEVARELVVSDKRGFENKSWGRLDEKQIEDKVSEVVGILMPYYRYEN